MEALKEQLEKLHKEYFDKYSQMERHDADKILLIGKCNGIGEALDLLEKL